MDRIWDTSKYLPKPFATLCRGYPGSRGQKDHFKIFGLGSVMHFWVRLSSRAQKNDPRTLLERRKSDKIRKSGKCRNPHV